MEIEVTNVNSSIRHAAEAVLSGRCRTTFVIDDDGILCGSVSEGDLVRAFLKGLNPDASVRHIMNPNPVFLEEGQDEAEARTIMNLNGHSAIPVIDSNRRLLRALKQTDI
jgi:CBS domain-containing protein